MPGGGGDNQISMTFARGRPKTKPTEAVDNKTLDTADKGGCEDAFNCSRHRGRLVGRLAASSKDQAGAVELACAARASRQLPQMPDEARGKGLGIGFGWGKGGDWTQGSGWPGSAANLGGEDGAVVNGDAQRVCNACGGDIVPEAVGNIRLRLHHHGAGALW